MLASCSQLRLNFSAPHLAWNSAARAWSSGEKPAAGCVARSIRSSPSSAMLLTFFNARKNEFSVPRTRQGKPRAPRNNRMRSEAGVSLHSGRITMKITAFLATMVAVIVGGLPVGSRYKAEAGQVPPMADYKVLAPIRHGNLTVFPVVASTSHDTGGFLTLDEGLRSGEVEVTESGSVRGMIRRRPPQGSVLNPTYPARDGAQVNRLVLVNNSKRPLVLLAGEIVTGGKQDRVIGKDRIVPADSDPIDLDVFCVEPGRWVGRSEKFEFGSIHGAMAAPS